MTDARFRPLCAFCIIEPATRRVVYVGATRHPTAARAAQQRREATPCGRRPAYRIRDNDRKYGAAFARGAAASGITILRPPHRVPQAKATCERFLGSVRRACTDHLLVLGKRHRTRVLREYGAYYNKARPHQGLGQATPALSAAATERRSGPIHAVPVLGGLHHTDHRAA